MSYAPSAPPFPYTTRFRSKRTDARIRLALTAVIRAALVPLFGVRLRDANVPFKVFRRSAWDEARRLIPADTLAPSLFLAVYVARRSEEHTSELQSLRHVVCPVRPPLSLHDALPI